MQFIHEYKQMFISCRAL